MRFTTFSGPTMKGSSVTSMPLRLRVSFTGAILAWTRIEPRPLSQIWRSPPSSESMAIPPEGKSGPGSTSSNWSMVGLGRRLVITSLMASATSRRLWGAMLVAMPTAIPVVPFTSRLGSRPGRHSGSVLSPS